MQMQGFDQHLTSTSVDITLRTVQYMYTSTDAHYSTVL